MVRKKTIAYKLLTFVLLFAFAFMYIRPLDVHADSHSSSSYIYVSVSAGQTVSKSGTYFWQIDGLTPNYVYDIQFTTYINNLNGTVLKGSYSPLTMTFSSGYSFAPVVGTHTYTVRVTAPATSLKLTLSYSFSVTNNGSQLQYWNNYVYIKDVSATFVSTGDPVLDELQKQTDVQKGQLEESKKQTQLQEEQNETSKGILSKITDFFNGFFDNLKDAVVSLVIPSSDDLFAFFEEVNEWFGERLGFIWYPFSLMADLVSALGSGSADQHLTIPAITLNLLGEQHTILQETKVDIDAFGFFQYVRFFTSAMMVSGVVKLAINKWDSWIGGRNAS